MSSPARSVASWHQGRLRHLRAPGCLLAGARRPRRHAGLRERCSLLSVRSRAPGSLMCCTFLRTVASACSALEVTVSAWALDRAQAGQLPGREAAPKTHGLVSRMKVAGNPRSIPAAASSRAAASSPRSTSVAPRLSRSWSRRRAPMMGWMAGDFLRVQAIATWDGVAPASSATSCSVAATLRWCSLIDAGSMRVPGSGPCGRVNLPDRIPPASGLQAATVMPSVSAIGSSSRSMSRCRRL